MSIHHFLFCTTYAYISHAAIALGVSGSETAAAAKVVWSVHRCADKCRRMAKDSPPVRDRFAAAAAVRR